MSGYMAFCAHRTPCDFKTLLSCLTVCSKTWAGVISICQDTLSAFGGEISRVIQLTLVTQICDSKGISLVSQLLRSNLRSREHAARALRPDAPMNGASALYLGSSASTHLAHTDQARIPTNNKHDIVGRATRQPKECRLEISVKEECHELGSRSY